jgi:6-pyruvoyl-tetrahydropterin synthase
VTAVRQILQKAGSNDDISLRRDKHFLKLLDAFQTLDDLDVSEADITSDVTGTSEIVAKAAQKALQDVNSFAESFLASVGFTREYLDTFVSAEEVANAVTKPLGDDSSTTDTLLMASTKALFDTTVTAELLYSAVYKSLDDTPALAETVSSIISYVRTFEDTPTTNEALANNVVKVIAESILSSDEFVAIPGRPVDDASTTYETLHSGVSKVLGEDVGSAEVVLLTSLFARYLEDTASVSEYYSVSFVKSISEVVNTIEHLQLNDADGPYDDVAQLQELIAQTFTKNIFESVELSEEFNRGLYYARSPDDIPTVSEMIFSVFSKVSKDILAVSEEGCANIQDYSSDLYTLPGYVGRAVYF